MIRHLLKLLWNRKRANALIVAEMFFSFIVLFGVLTTVVSAWQGWREPLGYDWRNVLEVQMELENRRRGAEKELHEPVMRMLDEIRAMPEVEAAALSLTPPYSDGVAGSVHEANGRSIPYGFDEVTDSFADVMRVEVIRGRWFTPADDGMAERPVVVDTNAARALFGDADPVGQKIGEDMPAPGETDRPRPYRVVGLVEAYRKDGETSTPSTMMFRRYATNGAYGILGRSFVVRLRPGTPAAFEERLVNRLQQLAPDMTFSTRMLERAREQRLRITVAPVVLAGIVGMFLIAMVALGLTGVLWQNVTRRTRELGLRRAVGAPGAAVNRQVLTEVALLATLAVVAGSIVVLQLPILGAFTLVTRSAFVSGFAGALATIYALTVLCGLYPSWLASRLEPADALRYE